MDYKNILWHNGNQFHLVHICSAHTVHFFFLFQHTRILTYDIKRERALLIIRTNPFFFFQNRSFSYQKKSTPPQSDMDLNLL